MHRPEISLAVTAAALAAGALVWFLGWWLWLPVNGSGWVKLVGTAGAASILLAWAPGITATHVVQLAIGVQSPWLAWPLASSVNLILWSAFACLLARLSPLSASHLWASCKRELAALLGLAFLLGPATWLCALRLSDLGLSPFE